MRSFAGDKTPLRILALAVLGLALGCVAHTTIPEIQAAAHRSPAEAREVVGVEGLVSAIREVPRDHGFWIESPHDREAEASAGIFVSTGEAPPTVRPGDRVRISAAVAERARRESDLPVTSLVESRVEILERGLTLPPPVRLGPGGREIPAAVIDDDGLARFEPEQDALDFWESLEGMRVEIVGARVVGAADSYGNLTVVTDDVPAESTAGGLLVSPDRVHAQRVEIDTRPVGDPPHFRVGDRIDEPIVGVVHYGFGNYRLHLTRPLSSALESARPTPARSVERHEGLTFATYNVLNLSAQSSQERFDRLAASITGDLGSPDLIALQEIQDDSGREDDGVVSASQTLRRLVEAITAHGGPRYEARQIDPEDGEDGGQPGGNIRVAYLVDPSRLEIVDRQEGDPRAELRLLPGPRLASSPGRLGVGHPCFEPDEEGLDGSRKTLALEVLVRGERIFLLNNHWTSKFGDDSLFGARQPPVRPSGDERVCQAQRIGEFVDSLLEMDPGAAVIVLGDFNDYDDQPALGRLTDVGLENLVTRIPRPDRYSHVHRGTAGALDHVFVSPRLAETVAEVTIVHVNADSPAQDRASDHDPVWVRLTLDP